MHLVLKHAGAVAAVLTVIGLSAPAQAATTSPAPAAAAPAGLAPHLAGGVTPLPDCAETLAPSVGRTAGRVCLRKLPAGAARTAAATTFPCFVEYFQNGPYGSNAWSNGWGICVQHSGNYSVPAQENDQASAFETECEGNFFVNGPGTFPGSGFNGNVRGNFPYGSVPNDSLSGIQVLGNCQIT
jgi:hypothetical protein